MLKQLLLFVAISSAVVCTSQTVTPGATHGRGIAQSADSAKAKFDFEAAKNARGVVRGQLNIGTKTTDGGAELIIPVVQRLAINRNVADFVGDAVLVIRKRGEQSKRIKGRAVVKVVDKKRPKAAGDPDAIAISFTSKERGGNIRFEGNVVDGDIVVTIKK